MATGRMPDGTEVSVHQRGLTRLRAGERIKASPNACSPIRVWERADPRRITITVSFVGVSNVAAGTTADGTKVTLVHRKPRLTVGDQVTVEADAQAPIQDWSWMDSVRRGNDKKVKREKAAEEAGFQAELAGEAESYRNAVAPALELARRQTSKEHWANSFKRMADAIASAVGDRRIMRVFTEYRRVNDAVVSNVAWAERAGVSHDLIDALVAEHFSGWPLHEEMKPSAEIGRVVAQLEAAGPPNAAEVLRVFRRARDDHRVRHAVSRLGIRFEAYWADVDEDLMDAFPLAPKRYFIVASDLCGTDLWPLDVTSGEIVALHFRQRDTRPEVVGSFTTLMRKLSQRLDPDDAESPNDSLARDRLARWLGEPHTPGAHA